MYRKQDPRYQQYIDERQESRFATMEEVQAAAKKVDLSHRLYTAGGLPLISDTKTMYVEDSDNHSIIYGSTGSGKTRRWILPMLHNLIRAGHNCVATDPKGELYDQLSGLAHQMGYRVILLDFRDLNSGDQWNPLTQPYRCYHNGKQDEAVSMTHDLMSGLAQPQANSSGDIFWVEMSECLGNGNFQIMLECFEEEYCNMANFANLCSEKNHEDMESFCEYLPPESPVALNLSGVYSSAEKTRQSIEVSLYGMIQAFTTNAKLMNMLQKSTFDMTRIGYEKTIVFLQIADEKPTMYMLVSLFLKQLYEVLVECAHKFPGHKLPITMDFVLDEFCNIPALPNFASCIAAARSRNIRYHMVVQSDYQLTQKYGEDAKTIKGNAQNWVFLNSRELPLLHEISELAGNITTRLGRSRPLISVSELQRLDKESGEALVFCKRLYPFVTHMPDISEYHVFPRMEPLPAKKMEMESPKIKDFHELVTDIRYGNFPQPFANKLPAIDYIEEILKDVLEKPKSKPEDDEDDLFDDLFGETFADDGDSDCYF